MEIPKAKKVVELTKDNRKILVTVLEGDKVASCVEEDRKKFCESCQCNEALCNEWIESLKAKGYQATEVEIGELNVEESLPRFLEERTRVEPELPSEMQGPAPALAEEETQTPAETEAQEPAVGQTED
jgi:hypothetical protein